MVVLSETHSSGWIGISMALSHEDIDGLIRALEKLKSGELEHFHIRRDEWPDEPMVSDIEISTQGEHEISNMYVEPSRPIYGIVKTPD